jgi:hypothetical protein
MGVFNGGQTRCAGLIESPSGATLRYAASHRNLSGGIRAVSRLASVTHYHQIHDLGRDTGTLQSALYGDPPQLHRAFIG